MSPKLQDDILPVFNQMTAPLEMNIILILIKSEDHYFDDFFLKQFVANDRTIRVWPLEINKLLTN
jgi:hypothetical protein